MRRWRGSNMEAASECSDVHYCGSMPRLSFALPWSASCSSGSLQTPRH